MYFTVAHDPTELDYQGPDHGSQYRSSIFYIGDEQKRVAEAAIRELTAKHVYSAPIVTKVVPFVAFYPAEAYHQHYLVHHPDEPYIVYNDMPKLKALHDRFPAPAEGAYLADLTDRPASAKLLPRNRAGERLLCYNRSTNKIGGRHGVGLSEGTAAASQAADAGRDSGRRAGRHAVPADRRGVRSRRGPAAG